MRSGSFAALSLVLAASSVSAQLSACATTCYTNSLAMAPACGPTNLACLCSSQAYNTAFATCLQTTCSAADAQAGAAFGIQSCAAVGVTVSAPAAASSAAATSGSAASSAASSGSVAASSAVSSVSSASKASSSIASSASKAASSVASASGSAGSAAASVKPASAGSLKVQGGLLAGAVLAALAL